MHCYVQIKRSFRKMLVAYRAIIISEFTEWNLSMLSDIEIKPVAVSNLTTAI